jgi:hypothetical protein
MPRLASPCLDLSYPALPRLALPRLALPCLALSWHCLVLSCLDDVLYWPMRVVVSWLLSSSVLPIPSIVTPNHNHRLRDIASIISQINLFSVFDSVFCLVALFVLWYVLACLSCRSNPPTGMEGSSVGGRNQHGDKNRTVALVRLHGLLS